MDLNEEICLFNGPLIGIEQFLLVSNQSRAFNEKNHPKTEIGAERYKGFSKKIH